MLGFFCSVEVEIGTAFPADGTTGPAEHPVSLTFTDPRSVDVVIESLQKVKAVMTSKEGEQSNAE